MTDKLPSAKKLYEQNQSGATEEEIAEKYNTTRPTVHGRIYRYKQKLEEEKFNFNKEEKEDMGEYRVGDRVGNNIVIEIDKNTGHVYCRSQKIRTLKKLLEVAQVNEDIWEVKSHIINKWDVTTGDGITYENWQVKAWLVRRNPIDIFPEINPVYINLSPQEPRRAIYSKNRYSDIHSRVLFVPDPHFGFDKDVMTGKLKPYHDSSVLQIALDIFSDNKFDYMIWGGDVLDANAWTSHFIKRPEFTQTTQPALNQAASWIGKFVLAQPDAKHIMLEGNHDQRLEKYVIDNLSEAYRLVPGDSENEEPLMSVSNLLGLKRMGVKYKKEFILGSTKFVHGSIARKGGGSTARAHLDNTIVNIVFAHVHRREMVTEVKSGYGGERREVFALCPGCACYVDGRVPGSKELSNWQNGFAVLDFLSGECVSNQIVNINSGRAFYNGKLYE